MTEDRHPTPDQSGETPTSSTATPQQAETRSVAPTAAYGVTARVAAEQRILREGEAARLALAQRTALEVLAEPGVLDAKRLRRLGTEGLACFVAELRAAALGSAQPAAPAAPPVQLAEAPPRAPARRPAAPALRRAEFTGWWLSQRAGRAGFEAQARRWGVLAGLVPLLASLAWLALSHR